MQLPTPLDPQRRRTQSRSSGPESRSELPHAVASAGPAASRACLLPWCRFRRQRVLQRRAGCLRRGNQPSTAWVGQTKRLAAKACPPSSEAEGRSPLLSCVLFIVRMHQPSQPRLRAGEMRCARCALRAHCPNSAPMV